MRIITAIFMLCFSFSVNAKNIEAGVWFSSIYIDDFTGKADPDRTKAAVFTSQKNAKYTALQMMCVDLRDGSPNIIVGRVWLDAVTIEGENYDIEYRIDGGKIFKSNGITAKHPKFQGVLMFLVAEDSVDLMRRGYKIAFRTSVDKIYTGSFSLKGFTKSYNAIRDACII